jgi:REP element-mobilizing transposase RayT
MSIHSHTRLLIHLIWSTHKHEKLINSKFRILLNEFLSKYSQDHSFGLVTSYVNADHLHALIDMPADQSVASIVKLLKGASSRWINQQEEQGRKFSWGRGYGAFSVSESNIKSVIRYIGNQEEHHLRKNYKEEFDLFLHNYQVDSGNR